MELEKGIDEKLIENILLRIKLESESQVEKKGFVNQQMSTGRSNSSKYFVQTDKNGNEKTFFRILNERRDAGSGAYGSNRDLYGSFDVEGNIEYENIDISAQSTNLSEKELKIKEEYETALEKYEKQIEQDNNKRKGVIGKLKSIGKKTFEAEQQEKIKTFSEILKKNIETLQNKKKESDFQTKNTSGVNENIETTDNEPNNNEQSNDIVR